jgi:hypothetical protein
MLKLKIALTVTILLAIAYAVFLAWGVHLVGFTVMAPWSNLEAGLIATVFAIESTIEHRKAQAIEADWKAHCPF